MEQTETELQNPLRVAVRAAAGRTDVRDAVEGVYRDLAAKIDQRRPVCVVSGRCCRFEEYDHRLYVTTLELAAFVNGFESGVCNGTLTAAMKDWDGTGCPFQIARLCGVHAIRPFGCRIFFCDPTATQWQQEAYEHFHTRLKRLHEELEVPYFYVEWRQALRAVLQWPTA